MGKYLHNLGIIVGRGFFAVVTALLFELLHEAYLFFILQWDLTDNVRFWGVVIFILLSILFFALGPRGTKVLFMAIGVTLFGIVITLNVTHEFSLSFVQILVLTGVFILSLLFFYTKEEKKFYEKRKKDYRAYDYPGGPHRTQRPRYVQHTAARTAHSHYHNNYRQRRHIA